MFRVIEGSLSIVDDLGNVVSTISGTNGSALQIQEQNTNSDGHIQSTAHNYGQYNGSWSPFSVDDVGRLRVVSETTAAPHTLSGTQHIGILSDDQIPDYITRDSELSTVSGVLQTGIDGKSDLGHTHDGRYYTETEADVLHTTLSGNLQDQIDDCATYNQLVTTSGVLQDQIDVCSSGTHFSNTVSVAVSGGDYTSIKEATLSVTGQNTDNRWAIMVYPGTYEEDNPIICKKYVATIGVNGKTSVVVKPRNPTMCMFELESIAPIENMQIWGVTGSEAMHLGVASTTYAEDVVFVNCKHGAIVDHPDAMLGFNNVNSFTYGAFLTGSLITVSGGKADVRNPTMLGNSIITEVIKADGPNSTINVYSLETTSSGVVTALSVDNGANLKAYSSSIHNCTTALKLDNASTMACFGVEIGDSVSNTCVIGDLNSIVKFIGGVADSENLTFPAGYKNNTALFVDCGTKRTTIHGGLAVGEPYHGSFSSFGKGDSYTNGMKVFTTDNTASNVNDGGNITDVSAAAATVSGSSFGFQGTTANHTILVGSFLTDGSDNLKTFGLKIKQLVAAVEVSKRSFATEYWNGSVWTECTSMATEVNSGYGYANEIFIRANTEECLSSYILDDWTKKNINGANTYWLRIRIKNNLTTAPTFEQFKIQTDRFTVNIDGICAYYGKAKFRQTILATGNVFGESGGVAASIVNIGSGGLPTGWSHKMKNNQLNNSGDAIYLQISLPKGICTAYPVEIKVIGHPEQVGASTNGTIIISALPIEIQGIKEADPAGGIVPVERTLANTETMVAKVAQIKNCSVPFADNTKLQSFKFDNINVSNYYEGDVLAVRVEMDDDGTGNKDYIVWSVEISGVKWTLGERT